LVMAFSFRCSAGLQACPRGGPEGPHYVKTKNGPWRVRLEGPGFSVCGLGRASRRKLFG
jgi:hypothetical protein